MSIKPSKRIEEFATAIAEQAIRETIKDPHFDIAKQILGVKLNEEAAIQHGINKMREEPYVVLKAIIEYLDEEADRIEKILSMNKCG